MPVSSSQGPVPHRRSSQKPSNSPRTMGTTISKPSPTYASGRGGPDPPPSSRPLTVAAPSIPRELRYGLRRGPLHLPDDARHRLLQDPEDGGRGQADPE